MTVFWLVLELEEKNSFLDRGLKPGLQPYILALEPLT